MSKLDDRPKLSRHFWSTDGCECLWCRTKRTTEEIAEWISNGSPDEPCPAFMAAPTPPQEENPQL